MGILNNSTSNIILDAPTNNTVISGKNVLIAASDTLVFKGGQKIIRDDDSANDESISTHYVVSAFSVSLNHEELDLASLKSQHERIVMLDFNSALSCPDVHENTKVYVRKLQE